MTSGEFMRINSGKLYRDDGVININQMVGMTNEGFKTDNFKSRRSLVRSSSTNFNARFSYNPDCQVNSNLSSERANFAPGLGQFEEQKRGKTS